MGCRESFFADFADLCYGPQEVLRSDEVVRLAMDCLGAVPPAPVLTLSAGWISFSCLLSEKMFDVVSYEVINTAREKGKREACLRGLDMRWISTLDSGSIADLGVRHAFVPGFSFGFFKDGDSFEVLRNLFRCLKPGGNIILELVDRDVLERYFSPKFWIEWEAGGFLLNERDLDFKSGILTENYTVVREGCTSKYSWQSRVYYKEEIIKMLMDVGFGHILAFGGMDKSELNDKSSSLVVVADKLNYINSIKC
jgi:hypothetical protein